MAEQVSVSKSRVEQVLTEEVYQVLIRALLVPWSRDPQNTLSARLAFIKWASDVFNIPEDERLQALNRALQDNIILVDYITDLIDGIDTENGQLTPDDFVIRDGYTEWATREKQQLISILQIFQDQPLYNATLQVKVIGATQLKGKKDQKYKVSSDKSRLNPYVNVWVRGNGRDKGAQKQTSPSLKGTANPLWNFECKDFEITKEGAVLTVEVRSDDPIVVDELVGTFNLAVEDLEFEGGQELEFPIYKVADQISKPKGKQTMTSKSFTEVMEEQQEDDLVEQLQKGKSVPGRSSSNHLQSTGASSSKELSGIEERWKWMERPEAGQLKLFLRCVIERRSYEDRPDIDPIPGSIVRKMFHQLVQSAVQVWFQKTHPEPNVQDLEINFIDMSYTNENEDQEQPPVFDVSKAQKSEKTSEADLPPSLPSPPVIPGADPDYVDLDQLHISADLLPHVPSKPYLQMLGSFARVFRIRPTQQYLELSAALLNNWEDDAEYVEALTMLWKPLVKNFFAGLLTKDDVELFRHCRDIILNACVRIFQNYRGTFQKEEALKGMKFTVELYGLSKGHDPQKDAEIQNEIQDLVQETIRIPLERHLLVVVKLQDETDKAANSNNEQVYKERLYQLIKSIENMTQFVMESIEFDVSISAAFPITPTLGVFSTYLQYSVVFARMVYLLSNPRPPLFQDVVGLEEKIIQFSEKLRTSGLARAEGMDEDENVVEIEDMESLMLPIIETWLNEVAVKLQKWIEKVLQFEQAQKRGAWSPISRKAKILHSASVVDLYQLMANAIGQVQSYIPGHPRSANVIIPLLQNILMKAFQWYIGHIEDECMNLLSSKIQKGDTDEDATYASLGSLKKLESKDFSKQIQQNQPGNNPRQSSGVGTWFQVITSFVGLGKSSFETVVTPQICVMLNNLKVVKDKRDEVKQKLMVLMALELQDHQLEDGDDPALADIAKAASRYQEVTQSIDRTKANVISCLSKMMKRKLATHLDRILDQTEEREDGDISMPEDLLEDLVSGISQELRVLYTNLYPPLFQQVLRQIWEAFLDALEEIILNQDEDADVVTDAQIQAVEDIWYVLRGSFHGNGVGLSLNELDAESFTFNELKEAYSWNSVQLTRKYDEVLERIKEGETYQLGQSTVSTEEKKQVAGISPLDLIRLARQKQDQTSRQLQKRQLQDVKTKLSQVAFGLSIDEKVLCQHDCTYSVNKRKGTLIVTIQNLAFTTLTHSWHEYRDCTILIPFTQITRMDKMYQNNRKALAFTSFDKTLYAFYDFGSNHATDQLYSIIAKQVEGTQTQLDRSIRGLTTAGGAAALSLPPGEAILRSLPCKLSSGFLQSSKGTFFACSSLCMFWRQQGNRVLISYSQIIHHQRQRQVISLKYTDIRSRKQHQTRDVHVEFENEESAREVMLIVKDQIYQTHKSQVQRQQ